MCTAFRTILLLTLAVSSVPACSRHRSNSPPPDRNLISRAEMDQHHFQTAHDAVAALHSNWLLTKGRDSFVAPGEVLVYLDNVKLGGVGELRNIAVISIEYIRYYDGVAATARWGLDHGHGVIYVSTHPSDTH